MIRKNSRLKWSENLFKIMQLACGIAGIWRQFETRAHHLTSSLYCCYSVSQSGPTLWDPMDCSTPGFPVLGTGMSPEFTQTQAIESAMSSNHLILCCPIFLLPSVFPSIRTFSNERLFTSSDQSIRTSASASVLPKNILSPSLYTKIREQQTNYFSLCS